jgi:predicted dehydrogenase
MNPQQISRRGFVAVSAAATAGLVSHAAEGKRLEKLSVGIVGPGGRGKDLLGNFFAVAAEQHADLTAVCDIWGRNREKAAALVKEKTGSEPRQFRSLEDMLGWSGLDAVIVATPDHAHARHLIACLHAGKHVYCEKPFANVLDDATAAIDAWRNCDRVVTIGTQRRSDPRYLAAADIMRSGVLGEVVRVEMVQNAYSPYRWRRDAEVAALKESDVDWKAFLMGKPMRKFDARQYLEFRLFRDFSSGIIDQWMTHMIDTVHMLTGATFPRSVVAHGGTYAWKDHRENGDTVAVLLDYPQGFLCSYNSALANGFGSGCSIQGRNGTLEVEDRWQVSGAGIPGSKLAAKPITAKEGMPSNMDHAHVADWLSCIRRSDRHTRCTPEHGYQHAIACIMSDRALRSGRRKVYDEKDRTIREG